MEKQQTGECPLCDTGVSFNFTDHENYKLIQCPDCGIFEISVGAERMLRDRYMEQRLEYAELSRNAPKGQMLVIKLKVTVDENFLVYGYAALR